MTGKLTLAAVRAMSKRRRKKKKKKMMTMIHINTSAAPDAVIVLIAALIPAPTAVTTGEDAEDAPYVFP